MPIENYREALRLILQTALSKREVARLVKLSRPTIDKCQRLIEQNAWTWQQLETIDDASLKAYFNVRRSAENGKVMPDWVHLHKLLQQKHAVRIELWEAYRSENKSNAYSYSQFNYYYKQDLKNVDVCMRQEHYAGEAIFVDYAGYTIPWFCPVTNSQKRAQIFVGVLGCSNFTFAFASDSQRLEDWVEAHVRMFAYFGGVPQVIVPDNLKSAVVKAGKDEVLNKTYQEMAEHYGVAIVPARVGRPQDKSHAEIGVKLITRWISVPLSRREFFSIEEINTAIVELLERFNLRSFKRLPGNRYERYLELDKPALKPLPETDYEYADWLPEQKVGSDYHIVIQQHAYSVPYTLAGKKVTTRLRRKTVEFFHAHKRVASHIRSQVVSTTTNPNHRLPAHQAYASQSFDSFVEWANGIGESVVKVVHYQFVGKEDYSIVGRKACSNLKSLARQYGEQRLEKACARALLIESPTLKSIHSILKHRIDEADSENGEYLSATPAHSNVRGANYYSDGGADYVE